MAILFGMAIKKISIQQLRCGMYVTALDISWFKSPFLTHHRHIRSRQDIDQLKKAGVQELEIDVDRGQDIGTGTAMEGQPALQSDKAPDRSFDQHLSDMAETNKNSRPIATPTLAERRKNNEAHTIPKAFEAQIQAAKALKKRGEVVARHTTEMVKQNKPLPANPMLEMIQQTIQSLAQNDQALLSLLHMSRENTRLLSHLFNVMSLSLTLASRLQCTESERQALGLAAFIHDAGWSRLPQNLLNCNRPYTASEFQLMQRHCHLLAQLLQKSDGFPPLIQRLIAEHHERCDGSGYPQGLREDQIHPLSKILMVADCYDEMIHGLANYQPIPPIKALRQLYQQSQQGLFDEAVVAQLINLVGIYPIQSAVCLDSGEKAVVMEIDRQDPVKPKVKVYYDSGGSPLSKPEVINLAEQGPARCIKNALDPTAPGVDPQHLIRDALAEIPAND